MRSMRKALKSSIIPRGGKLSHLQFLALQVLVSFVAACIGVPLGFWLAGKL